MARSTALTEPGIKRIAKAAPGKRVEKFDRLAPGLCLRVNDKGRKTWMAHYRLNGHLQKMSLGEWPEVKVDEARETMRKARAEAKQGIDPKRMRAQERAMMKAQADAEADIPYTFDGLAERYIQEAVPRLKRAQEYESIIRNRLIPEWQSRPLTSLRMRDGTRLTQRLFNRGHSAAALKLREVIQRIFTWGVAQGLIEINPFFKMATPVEKTQRQHVLSHAELQVLWTVCDAEGYPWGDLLKLLLLTGARRGEVAEMRWEELDDPDCPTVWTVPVSRSKNKRLHRVPLSGPARQILADLPRFSQGSYVFTSKRGEKPVSGFSKTAARIRTAVVQRAKNENITVNAEFRWHDLRRTMRTELARLGVDEIVAERIINHAGDPLVRNYNVYAYEPEKREALDRWGEELMSIVAPRQAAHGVGLGERLQSPSRA